MYILTLSKVINYESYSQGNPIIKEIQLYVTHISEDMSLERQNIMYMELDILVSEVSNNKYKILRKRHLRILLD